MNAGAALRSSIQRPVRQVGRACCGGVGQVQVWKRIFVGPTSVILHNAFSYLHTSQNKRLNVHEPASRLACGTLRPRRVALYCVVWLVVLRYGAFEWDAMRLRLAFWALCAALVIWSSSAAGVGRTETLAAL